LDSPVCEPGEEHAEAVEKIAMREPTGERKAHVSGAVIPLRRNNS
jgi:hypothetical protein